MREILKTHSIFLSKVNRKDVRQRVYSHRETAYVEYNETVNRWKTCRPLIKRRMGRFLGQQFRNRRKYTYFVFVV